MSPERKDDRRERRKKKKGENKQRLMWDDQLQRSSINGSIDCACPGFACLIPRVLGRINWRDQWNAFLLYNFLFIRMVTVFNGLFRIWLCTGALFPKESSCPISWILNISHWQLVVLKTCTRYSLIIVIPLSMAVQKFFGSPYLVDHTLSREFEPYGIIFINVLL
jgi:hypothetical protein